MDANPYYEPVTVDDEPKLAQVVYSATETTGGMMNNKYYTTATVDGEEKLARVVYPIGAGTVPLGPGEVAVGSETGPVATALTELDLSGNASITAAVDANPTIATHTAAIARVDPGTAGSAGQHLAHTTTGPVWLRDTEVNVLHPRFGVVGDGVNDDTAGIQAALDTNAAIVVFPQPPVEYKITGTITPKRDQTMRGQSSFRPVSADTTIPVRIRGNFDGTMVALNNPGVTIEGITFKGSSNAAHLFNIGIEGTAVKASIRYCTFETFGGPAIKQLNDGGNWEIVRNFTTNCVMSKDSLTDWAGACDLAGTDNVVQRNEFGARGTSFTNGFSCALLLRRGNGFFSDNMCELSEHGVVLLDPTTGCSFIGNRADVNLGHGFIVDGAYHTFVGNKSHNNSTAAHNTYDGFHVNAWSSTFVGNTIYENGSPSMRYGFYDFTDGGATGLRNMYIGNSFRGTLGTGNYNMTTFSRFIDMTAAAPAYTVTNALTDRTYDADTVTVAELADVVGTLIADLQSQGWLRS